MQFTLSQTAHTLVLIFAIACVGYLIGKIKIRGVGLGGAGIFLSGLLFGHFGAELPAVTQTLGLVLFITAVGFSAGPGFLTRLRQNGLQYAALCLFTALIGSLLCVAIIRLFHIEAPLAVGMMTGAFTTSPGFAAAKEAAGDAGAAAVAAGYGMVYPVGVITKVLFIQLIPRFLHADMERERQLIAIKKAPVQKKDSRALFRIDHLGLSAFSFAAAVGVALGCIHIALPGGGQFALGTTGGPLLMGLLLACRGRIGKLDLTIDQSIITPAKEIGLLLFFSGAGVEGGKGIARIISAYGLLPLILGFFLVAVPLLAGFTVSRKLLHLPMLSGLGSMAASMTSTPSLAELTEVAGTDDVALPYATTYPIALLTLVIVVQFLVRL